MTSGILLYTAGAAERAPYGLALCPIEILAEVERRQPGGRDRVDTKHAHHVGTDDGCRGEHDRSLDRVLELAHVAGPVGRLKRFDHPRLHAVDAFTRALRVFRDEVIDENRTSSRARGARDVHGMTFSR